MRWIRAIILAFSTYTRIPMPQVKWDDEAMKLAIAFLPLVGAVISCALWGWQIFCKAMGFSPVLFASVGSVFPILITGGIHMDGYCDTVDAISSWQSRERRLEILKDPHVGAFALIHFGVYMLINFGLFHEIYINESCEGILFLYPLSRCLAALSAISMPSARKDGMLAAFTQKTDRKKVCAILALFIMLASAGTLRFASPVGLVLCLPLTLWYRRMTAKRFGGVTGDTTGFYLQMIELILLVGMLLGCVAA